MPISASFLFLEQPYHSKYVDFSQLDNKFLDLKCNFTVAPGM